MSRWRKRIWRCPSEASCAGDGRDERGVIERSADGEVQPLERWERAEQVWERLPTKHPQGAAVCGLGTLEGAADP